MKAALPVFMAFALALVVASCTGVRAKSRSLPVRKKPSVSSEEKRRAPALAVLPGEGVTSVEDLINEEIEESAGEPVSDPLEPVNRVMHGLNDRVYNYLLEPVSKAYETVMPDTVERGVANAFTNLRYPKRFAGNLLQGKIDGAAKETGKFLVNSTVGVLGFSRAADRYPSLSTSPEDMGQVLGRWKVGRGPYLVLPVLGPNTLRDSVGLVGDGFLDPVLYAGPVPYRLGARALEHVNDSPSTLADYNALKEGAIDPYIALRDAYIQSRDEQTKE